MAAARPSCRPARRGLLGAVLLGLCTASASGGDQEAAAATEVKADYLYKLALFVEWPGSAFATPTTPVAICVLGNDPLAAALEKVVAGKTRGRRPIVAKRLRRADPDAGCQIAYVAETAGVSVPDALQTFEGDPVLTVTESEASDRRGMVNFVLQDNRIRFEIDDAAAAQNCVEISAKVLKLALSVRRKD
jgi:hypothetical protein